MKIKNIEGIIAIILIAMVAMLCGCIENPLNAVPTNIIVDIQSPSYVHEKEDFNIIITVENTAINPQKLTSIDIPSSYLEGISIISSDPLYDSELKVPIFNAQCYFYDTDIPSSEKIIINLSALALTRGNYSGYIA